MVVKAGSRSTHTKIQHLFNPLIPTQPRWRIPLQPDSGAIHSGLCSPPWPLTSIHGCLAEPSRLPPPHRGRCAESGEISSRLEVQTCQSSPHGDLPPLWSECHVYICPRWAGVYSLCCVSDCISGALTNMLFQPPPHLHLRLVQMLVALQILERLTVVVTRLHIQVCLSTLGYCRKRGKANSCAHVYGWISLPSLFMEHTQRWTYSFLWIPWTQDRRRKSLFIFYSNQEVPPQIRLSGPHVTGRRGHEALQGDLGRFLQNRTWPLIRAAIYSAECDILMICRESREQGALRCFNRAFLSASA